MTHDDETVERVARAICWSVTGGEHDLNARDMAGNRLRDQWQDYERHARAALSAMPERELLREALSALDEMVEWFGPPIGPPFGTGEREAIKQARAAADKIRAALGGE